ncbi:polysaccharide biosynthesis/export family protein [Stakelama tenebrarum]|uniref:Polysaccharide export protein n=1 Tax=Stakelama tenebrarum TaxID=2711215 RepID=A0A6G6Y4A0_9SPHN|nr:polysaccharide biosynthesis/export family protein [Sphingosinithalassobacter tenebrarum]QIG79548.1 polysaccharide export protein [Sphingosinithalassobacter tenebrarum]
MIFSADRAVGRAVVSLALLAAALSGCASSNAVSRGETTAAVATQALPEPDLRVISGRAQEAYYIGTSDKLDITVVDLPELTKETMVDPSGAINLPYVGRVMVAGHTPEEVRGEIRQRLGSSVMVDPDVTVAVSEAVSQTVTIEGAVSRPGIYPIAGESSLLRAMAMARGANAVANERLVVVFRTIDGQRMAAAFDLHRIREGTMEDPAIFGHDVIVVERSRGKVLLRDIIGTLPIVGAFTRIDRIVD